VTAPDSHERYAELAAGHALHALEPGDEQVFLSHLASCADCQHELTLHTDTLGHLAYAAEPAELPGGILAGIRSEIGPAAFAEFADPGSMAPVASLDAARSRRRGLEGRALVAAAAAAAMVLSLGIWNVALHRQKSNADVRAERLAAAVSTLEAGAKHRVNLTDAQGSPVAIAVVRADDTVSLVVDGLARNNRATSTYVLWQKGSYGVVRAVGTFDVRGAGVDVIPNLALARDVVGVEGFAVTKEPGRHAPAAPGSKPVADGTLSA
jgi:hypothetical protein